MARSRRAGRRPAAASLCKPFEGTILVGCARAGLEVLEREHKAIVLAGPSTACGVPLDRCRQPHDPDAPRWDYVFTVRDADRAVAVEVHHADGNEVDLMIAKKNWAATLLAAECPGLHVERWVWVAPNDEIMLLRQHPKARLLAEAKIEFPCVRCQLP